MYEDTLAKEKDPLEKMLVSYIANNYYVVTSLICLSAFSLALDNDSLLKEQMNGMELRVSAYNVSYDD